MLVLCSRLAADGAFLREQVDRLFPGSRVTWLLPDTFPDASAPVPSDTAEVLTYPEGGRETWGSKVRSVLALRRVCYRDALCPFRAEDPNRYAKLVLVLLAIRARRRRVLFPGEDVTRRGRGGVLALYLRFRWERAVAFWWPRLRAWGYHVDKAWIGERLDGPLWLCLALLARLRHAMPRPRGSQRPRNEGPLRIAHFISSLEMGGTQRQLLTFLERARLPHVRLFVYTTLEGAFEGRLQGAGVVFTRVRRRHDAPTMHPVIRFCWRHLPNTLATLRLARSLRESGGVDLIHNWEFTANLLGAVAGTLTGTPAIASVRNMTAWQRIWYRRWWYLPADRITAGLNHAVIANAEAVRADYLRTTGVAPRRVHTVPNGLDPDTVTRGGSARSRVAVRRELGFTGATSVVGWVGRLAPEKGPLAFLELAQDLLRSFAGLCFVLVGDGPLRGEILEARRALGLEGRVRLPGARPNPYPWMEAMDVLVATSIIEGLPNVLIEAQMIGTPCVTTDAGGAGEVVLDGVTGFVVPVGDRAALRDRVARLLSDEETAARFAEVGRLRARECFHADRMVQATLELYEAAAARRATNRKG